jgi:hypothetical protein
VPRPTQRSKEVIPSSGEGAPSDVTTHNNKEGVKGFKKRLKQCLQGAATTTVHDDSNDREAGGSSMRHSSTAAHIDKR